LKGDCRGPQPRDCIIALGLPVLGLLGTLIWMVAR
jgi:hypothetical protein